MHYWTLLQLLGLVTLANGTPVVAKRLFGARFARPLDGNCKFIDGRPLFGASKTTRGLLLSVVATSVCAPLVGLGITIGFVVAVSAMAGDLLSSFVKRRLALAPSSQAIGLDQIPESLLPLLACRHELGLTAADIAMGVALFFVGELALSRVLFRLRFRDRPY
jgi:CDP-2,3-bis-(O-geranylgeranyl)-sn-glycerol synthase